MKTPERIDLFEVDSSVDLPHGYYRLAKNSIWGSGYLPQIAILPSIPVHEPDYPYIVDRALFETIQDGDIGMYSGRNKLRVILSRLANHNTLLLTERCDNRCLFCSQPPKTREDSWLLESAEKALLDFNFSGTIGLSGGEPLLYGGSLIKKLKNVLSNCPETNFHILSNGRALKDSSFCRELAGIGHPGRIVLGVPVYGTSSDTHDSCVDSSNAFNETLIGLINAGNAGIPLEIRIIPTKLNHAELSGIIELVGRCISSVVQVSIMNLEPTGWAKRNWESLYLSPSRYQDDLIKAIQMGQSIGVKTVLFNYPLCHLPEDCRSQAVKSISDWKNFYPTECDDCLVKSICGGYFTSTGGERFDPPRRIA